jgi:hypothetical protein
MAALLVGAAGCSPAVDDGLDAGRVASSSTSRAGGARSARELPPTGTSAASPDSTSAMGAGATPSSTPPAMPGGHPAASGVDDAQITARVKAELAAARDLPGVQIDVDTRDGVVTLSGAVRSAAVKARAGEIARTVRGVVDVNDQLTLAIG